MNTQGQKQDKLELSRDEKLQNIRTVYIAVVGELNNYRHSMLQIVASSATLYIAIFAWYLSHSEDGTNIHITYFLGYLFLTIVSWEILVVIKRYIRQLLTIINKCEEFMGLFDCNTYIAPPILPVEWRNSGDNMSIWTESYLRIYRSISFVAFFVFMCLGVYKNYQQIYNYWPH